MLETIEFYLLIVFIVFALLNIVIGVAYEKYLKREQAYLKQQPMKFIYFKMARKFAKDHPIFGRAYLY